MIIEPEARLIGLSHPEVRLWTRQHNYSTERSLNQWKDRLGIIASVVCAVHCAATPILIALLPALKITQWMISPRFHQVVAIGCVAMVMLAIWPAFRKYRDYGVLYLSSAGLALLIAAAFFMSDECCNLVLHENAVNSSPPSNHTHTVIASVIGPEVLSLIQPWMTPLGGVLLVMAHSLNLRRRVSNAERCDCRCVSREDTSLMLVNSKAA